MLAVIFLVIRHVLLKDGVASVTFLCAADGINGLGPVQVVELCASRAGGFVLDSQVLLPIAHDLNCDSTLVRQRCAFVFRGML